MHVVNFLIVQLIFEKYSVLKFEHERTYDGSVIDRNMSNSSFFLTPTIARSPSYLLDQFLFGQFQCIIAAKYVCGWSLEEYLW